MSEWHIAETGLYGLATRVAHPEKGSFVANSPESAKYAVLLLNTLEAENAALREWKTLAVRDERVGRRWRASGYRIVRTSINGDLPGAEDDLNPVAAAAYLNVLQAENAALRTKVEELDTAQSFFEPDLWKLHHLMEENAALEAKAALAEEVANRWRDPMTHNVALWSYEWLARYDALTAKETP